jgi:hypothetical protein
MLQRGFGAFVFLPNSIGTPGAPQQGDLRCLSQ